MGKLSINHDLLNIFYQSLSTGKKNSQLEKREDRFSNEIRKYLKKRKNKNYKSQVEIIVCSVTLMSYNHGSQKSRNQTKNNHTNHPIPPKNPKDHGWRRFKCQHVYPLTRLKESALSPITQSKLSHLGKKTSGREPDILQDSPLCSCVKILL